MTDKARALIERLFTEHGSALRAYLYRRTGNLADACELAQEAYLKMLQVKDIEAIVDPRRYLFTIGANLAIERLKSQGRFKDSLDADDPLADGALAQTPDYGEAIDREETLKKVRRYLDELRPEVKAAYILQVGHGMSYEEIALHLGVSKDTVKKYLQQVLAHCRKRWLEDEEDDT